MFRSLLIALLLTFGLTAQDTVVVLLRHAEKAHKGDAAQLSEAGQRRAAALPGQFTSYHPVALFASNLRRTQQTLTPLSKALALPLQIYDRGMEQALGRRILILYTGETVVVCGHSDTLMVLLEALGYPLPFAEVRSFDRYWVLRIKEGSGEVSLQEHRQKSPSSSFTPSPPDPTPFP